MNHRTTAAFLFTLAIASVATAQTNAAGRPKENPIVDTLEVTGSVISTEGNRLIVENDNGQQMVFIITDKQIDASMFHPGDRVTASYVTLAGTGAVISKLVAAPPLTTTTTTTTYVAPAAEAKVTPPAVAVTTTVAPVAARPNDQTNLDNASSAGTLPLTASPMPLVALLGLLGAGGAATIRRFRRS